MSKQLSPRLRKSLEWLIKFYRGQVEQWDKYLEDEGLKAEQLSFKEWVTLPPETTQYQLFHEVADAFLEQSGRIRTPWPKISADDIIDAIGDALSKDGVFPDIPVTTDQLYDRLTDAIRRIKKQGVLYFDVPVRCRKDHEFLDFATEFRNPHIGGIRSVTRTWERHSEHRGNLQIRVKCLVTDNTKSAFEQSILDILWQAAVSSSIGQCVCLRLFREPGYYVTQVPRTYGRHWDRDSISDGAYPMPDKRNLKDPAVFQFPVSLNMLDAKRFVWLCSEVIFNAGQKPAVGNRQMRENIIRHSIWRMAECSRLGESPLALVGYAGVFERAISGYIFDCQRLGEGKAKQIAGKLNLNSDVTSVLENLFNQRNESVHETSYQAPGRDLRQFWRLAKIALHHLIAKLTKTELWNEKTNLARKIEDLKPRSAFDAIEIEIHRNPHRLERMQREKQKLVKDLIGQHADPESCGWEDYLQDKCQHDIKKNIEGILTEQAPEIEFDL